jgi:hypothetical protein
MKAKILRTNNWYALGLSCAALLYALLPQFAIPSEADTDMGCKWPLYNANPLCGLLPGGSTCSKWQFSIAPSSCDGGANNYHCYQYQVPCQLWLYSKSGTTEADCDCSTGDWVPNPNNPQNDNVNQAYNNDTQCYE